jgi:hypothetical protein
MNLNIENENFGFRITPNELESLLQGRDVEQSLCIGNHCFGYRITTARTESDIALEMAVGGFCLYVPRGVLEQLRDLGPSKHGLTIVQSGVEVNLRVEAPARTGLQKAA